MWLSFEICVVLVFIYHFISVCDQVQVDLVFLLDSSSSMGYSDFLDMKTFVKYVVSKVDITNGSSRVGVYTFSNQAKLEFSLNTYSTNTDVLKAVDKIPQAFGNTNTAAGFRAIRTAFSQTNGDRDRVPNIAVLITDGQANMEADQTLPQAQLIKDSGIYMYAIGVRLRDYQEFLQIPSPPSNKTAILLPDFASLVRYGSVFTQKVCEGNT